MRKKPFRLVKVALFALACLGPIAASSAALAQALDPADFTDATLEPGAFVWRPEAAPAGPVNIVVSLPLQTAYVFRAGVLIGVSSVSTGKAGHETPVGSFTILQKDPDHHSNLYDDASMPFMQRLTWDGLALHAGRNPGRPASHGCVRLPTAFAAALYRVTELGASVEITDDAAPPFGDGSNLGQPAYQGVAMEAEQTPAP